MRYCTLWLVLIFVSGFVSGKEYYATFSLKSGVLESGNGETIGVNQFKLTDEIPNSEVYRYDCLTSEQEGSFDPYCTPMKISDVSTKTVTFKNRESGKQRYGYFRLFRLVTDMRSGSNGVTSGTYGCSLNFYSGLAAGSYDCTSHSQINKKMTFNVLPSKLWYFYELELEDPQDWEAGVWQSMSHIKFISKGCNAHSSNCNGVYTDHKNGTPSTPMNVDKFMNFVISVEPRLDVSISEEHIELAQSSPSSTRAKFIGGTGVSISSNVDNLKVSYSCGTGLTESGGSCVVNGTDDKGYLSALLEINGQSALYQTGKYYYLRNMKSTHHGRLSIEVNGPKAAFKEDEYTNSIMLTVKPWFE